MPDSSAPTSATPRGVVVEERLVIGKYIYCITQDGAEESYGPLGIGGRGDEVHPIPYRDIAAVVSDAPIRRYRVGHGDNSLVHERAVEAVFKRHTVLPVRFGTIAENEAKVRAILEREYDRFTGMLGLMRDKVEVGVKAIFHRTLVYEDILEQYEEIRRRKEAAVALPAHMVHRELVEIGGMVEVALEAEKARVREDILDALKASCYDFRLSDRLLGERMIANAAFLVDQYEEAAFERRVESLAQRYGDRIMLRYVTGFPPFTFVDLHLQV